MSEAASAERTYQQDYPPVTELPITRVQYLQGLSLRPGKGGMPEADFLRIYGRWRFVRRDVMLGMEKYEQVAHCAKCLSVDDQGAIHAHRMMVECEKDLLGNFPSVLKLTCFGCGANEMVPCSVSIGEVYEAPSYGDLYDQWKKVRAERSAMNQQAQMMGKSGAAAMQQSLMQQQQMQAMQHRMDQINSMIGQISSVPFGMIGGAGGAGGAAMGAPIQGPPNHSGGPPMTATEVQIRQAEYEKIRRMKAVSPGVIDRLRDWLDQP